MVQTPAAWVVIYLWWKINYGVQWSPNLRCLYNTSWNSVHWLHLRKRETYNLTHIDMTS